MHTSGLKISSCTFQDSFFVYAVFLIADFLLGRFYRRDVTHESTGAEDNLFQAGG